MTGVILPDGSNYASREGQLTSIETKIKESKIEAKSASHFFYKSLNTAEEKALIKDGKFYPDEELYKKASVREVYFNALSESMIEYTRKRTGISNGTILETRVVEAIFGVPLSYLKEQIDEQKKECHTFLQERLGPRIKDSMLQKYVSDHTSVMDKSWSPDVLKYIGADDFIDATKLEQKNLVELLLKFIEKMQPLKREMFQDEDFLIN